MKLLLLASSFLIAGLAAQAAYRDEVLADQPVAYWRLGDPGDATTAANAGSLGASADGALVNSVLPGVPGALAGDSDTAMYFEGAAAQSKIEVPFAEALNPTRFTIEAWARVTFDSAGHRSPLASRNDGPQKGYIFYCNPANTWEFWTGTGAQVGWNVLGGPYAYAEPDLWAHLVGVYDGTNKLFYVNGVLVDANQSVFAPNDANPLRIGASANENPVGDFFFAGDLDEVAVYDHPLESARVVTHFRAGAGYDPSPDIFPEFALQPSAANRFKGESVSLTALAIGSLPLTYQWQKDGADLPGATSPTLALTDLQPADGGSYVVIVRNGAGETFSEPAVLDVADLSRPVITQQPRPRTVLPGSPASFSVAATGSTTFDYQWTFNGEAIAGATNVTLALTNIQTSNLGAYQVTVSNAAGTTESDPATLQFPAPATKAYADTVRDDNPAGYWRLGESSGDLAEDETSANWDGFYLNGVTLGRPGAPVDDSNTAAGFTSANQTKVDIDWNDDLNHETFTAECWAKVTGGSSYRSPLTSRADGPQRGYIFYAAPNNTWQLWIGTGEPVGWISLIGPAVQNDAYTHLVGSYDGTRLAFYVNGVLVGERETAFGRNDEWPLRIGGGATEGDGNYFFEGDVDEVAIYGQALSEERILAHYVAGFPLTTPPSITRQPVDQLAPPGATVSFTVGATGGLPLEYQWRFQGADIPGAITDTLTLNGVTRDQAGAYSVRVTNAGGNVVSDAAELRIPEVPTDPYATLVRASGPTAYWRLGETSGDLADDQIGANDGFYVNGVTLGVPGIDTKDANTAVHFSAADSQKIDVFWFDTLLAPAFAAEAWVRLTGGSGSYRSPLTSRADTPQRGFIFYAAPADNWQFWTGRGDTSGWDNITGPAVNYEQWTHLVGTYDGTTKRFYVNGVLVGSSTTAYGGNDEWGLRIGAGATEGDGSFFFDGDVDEVALYDKALSHESIIHHYLAGAPVVEAPTLSFARSGDDLVLTWSGGTLESSTAVSGSWTPVAGATPPWTVQTAGAAGFYRVRQ